MASGRMRFHSAALDRQTNLSFVLPNDVPPAMAASNPCYARGPKSVLLLHGYSGGDCDWEYNGIAEEIALRFNVNVFMIDGGNDFYLDREATGRKYQTFAGVEAPAYIRRTFGVSERREDWIIAGLSMGGFGALHTALACPGTFSAAVCLSSALIVRQVAAMEPGFDNGVANYAYYREVFGDPEQVLSSDANPEVLYDRCRQRGEEIPRIYMAVGTEDFLYEANQEMRRFLEGRGAAMKYEEGPGVHDWAFWNVYILKGLEWALSEERD